MDPNGLRFWMLSAAEDWLPLPDQASDVHHCAKSGRLQLRSRPVVPPADEIFTTAAELVEEVPFARDQYGNYARWDSKSQAIVAGGNLPGEQAVHAPPPTEPPTDLVLGYDGVLYIASAGKLILVDRRGRWSPFTFEDPRAHFWRLVAHPEGGVIALDRQTPQLLRFQGSPLGDLPPRPVAPHVLRPCEENLDPPRLTQLAGLPIGEFYVGLNADETGRLVLLSWSTKSEDNSAAWLRIISALDDIGTPHKIEGLRFPYSLSWLPEQRIALLATQNKEAFVYRLEGLEAGGQLPAAGETFLLSRLNVGPFAHGFAAPPHYNDGAELLPLLPLSLNALAASGQAANRRVIDSGKLAAAWHRLFVEAVLPPRCGVVVWLAAHDDAAELDSAQFFPHVFGEVPEVSGFSEVPRAAWRSGRSEVPFHPGLLQVEPQPQRNGVFMALIQRADRAVRTLRGRYLAVRIQLFGDQRSTPEIAALRVYGPRFSYVENYLPQIYREDLFGPEAEQPGRSTRADFFERFVNLTEAQMTDIEAKVASAHLLTDPRSTHDDAIDWLGGWIGVTPDAEPADRRRARVRATPTLHRERGTIRGVIRAIDIATRGLCSRGAVVLLEDYRLRHTFATVLGANLGLKDDPLLPGHWESANSFVGDTLFLGDEERKEFLALFAPEIATAIEHRAVDAFYADLAHRLTVFVHDEIEPVDRQLVLRVVEREKPAHVAVSYKRASEPFLIGLASLLGINSYLGQKPAPEQARIDISAIGRGSFITQPAVLDPRLEDGRQAGAMERPVARIKGPDVALVGGVITLDGSESQSPPGTRITNHAWAVAPSKP